MNQDFNNIEEGNDDLQDAWLTENLKFTQREPSLGFTQKVIEQIEVKPNPLSSSPLFWILAVIPIAILLWLILSALGDLNSTYHFNLHFIPNISSYISLYTLCKYVLMITLAGLFFIGFDLILNKGITHHKSFFTFLLV